MKTVPFNFKAIDADLKKGRGNAWVYGQFVSLYYRVGYHRTGDRIRQTLDVSTVYVTPSEKGKGRFTKVLEKLEAQVAACSTASAVWVENVQTKRFADFWRRRGYLEANAKGIDGAPCFYKVFNENATDLKPF